jgi:hypothetical protein
VGRHLLVATTDSLTIGFSVDIGRVTPAQYDQEASALNAYISAGNTTDGTGFLQVLQNNIHSQGLNWDVNGITVNTQASTYNAYCAGGGQGCPIATASATSSNSTVMYVSIGCAAAVILLFILILILWKLGCCKPKKTDKEEEGEHHSVQMNPVGVGKSGTENEDSDANPTAVRSGGSETAVQDRL